MSERSHIYGNDNCPLCGEQHPDPDHTGTELLAANLRMAFGRVDYRTPQDLVILMQIAQNALESGQDADHNCLLDLLVKMAG